MRLLLTGLLVLILASCASKPELDIVQRPIIFDAQREQLSLEYLEQRYGVVKQQAKINPSMVVVHWTVIPTLEKTFGAFNPSTLPSARKNISSASALNVSSHFVVDRDGTIYQLLPTDTFARHVIGLNNHAIGIENIADGKELPLTEEQIEANIKLILYLSKQYKFDYVIGHHEYKRFIGHVLWQEKDPGYLTVKTDPGDANMRRIRAGLARIDLKRLP